MIPTMDDEHFRKNLPRSTTAGEGFQVAVPMWVDYNNPWQTKIPLQHLEVIQGKAEIREVERSSTKHEYIVYSNGPLELRENTLYFPGWIVTANKQQVPVTYNKPGYPGVMAFHLSKGLYKIDVMFQDTRVRQMASVWSSLTVFGVLLSMAVKSYRKFKKRTKSHERISNSPN